MRLIQQADIIKLIKNYYNVSYKVLSIDTGIDSGQISKAKGFGCKIPMEPQGEKSKKKEPPLNIIAEKYFEIGTKTDPDLKLAKLKDYLSSHDLDVDEITGGRELDYDGFVTALLNKGWQRNDGVAEKESITPAAHLKNEPTLRCQHFSAGYAFTGRDDILKKIDRYFRNDYHAVVLCGIPGIGKRTIAEAYANIYRKRNKDCAVCKVKCQDSDTPFTEMILSLGFENYDDEQLPEKTRLENRIQLLEKYNRPALLIFDNIKKKPSDISLFHRLRENCNIQILVTSCVSDRNTFDKSYTIEVSALSEPEAIQLFCTYLLEEPPEENTISEMENNKYLKDLLKHIDYHTMMIELIAHEISYNELEISEMLHMLKDGASEVAEPIWNTVKTVIFSTKLNSDEKEVLLLASLLPDDGVRSRWFTDVFISGKMKTINSLTERSWLSKEALPNSISGKVIRVHPVIKEVLLREFSPNFRKMEGFFKKLDTLCSNDENYPNENDICKLCRSSVYTACKIINSSDFPEYSESDIRLMIRFAEYCNRHYHFYDAKEIYQLAQKAEERKDHGHLASINLRLGEIHQRLARYSDAISCYQTAMSLFSDDEGIAECLRHLGIIFRKDSQYDKAEEYNNKALQLYKKLNNTLALANVLNELGVMYINLGDSSKEASEKEKYYDKCINNYNEALKLREAVGELCPPSELAFSHHNLGTIFCRKEQFEDAIKKHRKALKIRLDNHLSEADIAASRTQLAQDYISLAKKLRKSTESEKVEVRSWALNEAGKQLEKALETRRRLLGEKHPDYAWTLNTKAMLKIEMQDLKSAEKLIQQVLEIRESALGESHEYTKRARSLLSEIRKNLK